MAFCFDEFNLYPGFVVAAVATIGFIYASEPIPGRQNRVSYLSLMHDVLSFHEPLGSSLRPCAVELDDAP